MKITETQKETLNDSGISFSRFDESSFMFWPNSNFRKNKPSEDKVISILCHIGISVKKTGNILKSI